MKYEVYKQRELKLSAEISISTFADINKLKINIKHMLFHVPCIMALFFTSDLLEKTTVASKLFC